MPRASCFAHKAACCVGHRPTAAHALAPRWAVLATIGIVGLSILAGLVLLMLLGGGSATLNLPGRQDAAAEASAGLRFFAIWQVGVVVLTLLASTLFGGRMRDVLALRPAAGGWRSYGGAVLALAVLQIAVSGVQYMTSPRDLFADLRPFVELVRGPGWGCWRPRLSASARRCRKNCCFGGFSCRRWRKRASASGVQP